MTCDISLLYVTLVLVDFVTLSSSIYRGKQAVHGQFKFAVEIKSYDVGDPVADKCSGSILTEYCVLTAAHCIADYEYRRLMNIFGTTIVVIAGLVGGPQDKGKTQERTAKGVYIHPDAYNEEEYRKKYRPCLTNECFDENMKYRHVDLRGELAFWMGDGVDIALLRLEKPFQFNQWVGNVDFEKIMSPLVYVQCTVVGFGVSDKRELYDEMNYLTLYFGAADYCKMVMPAGNLEYIKDYHLCGLSQVPYENICKGDSGGPVICKGKLYGVASKEPNTINSTVWCGLEFNVPIYYISTAAVVGWITTTMERDRSETDIGQVNEGAGKVNQPKWGPRPGHTDEVTTGVGKVNQPKWGSRPEHTDEVTIGVGKVNQPKWGSGPSEADEVRPSGAGRALTPITIIYVLVTLLFVCNIKC